MQLKDAHTNTRMHACYSRMHIQHTHSGMLFKDAHAVGVRHMWSSRSTCLCAWETDRQTDRQSESSSYLLMVVSVSSVSSVFRQPPPCCNSRMCECVCPSRAFISVSRCVSLSNHHHPVFSESNNPTLLPPTARFTPPSTHTLAFSLSLALSHIRTCSALLYIAPKHAWVIFFLTRYIYVC